MLYCGLGDTKGLLGLLLLLSENTRGARLVWSLFVLLTFFGRTNEK